MMIDGCGGFRGHRGTGGEQAIARRSSWRTAAESADNRWGVVGCSQCSNAVSCEDRRCLWCRSTMNGSVLSSCLFCVTTLTTLRSCSSLTWSTAFHSTMTGVCFAKRSRILRKRQTKALRTTYRNRTEMCWASCNLWFISWCVSTRTSWRRLWTRFTTWLSCPPIRRLWK